MMRTVFDVLSCSMGTPPKPDAEFFWETYDRDGKYLKVEMTPKAFYKKYTGPYRPNECFSLINDPRNEYEKLYTVDRLGNVSGGMSVRCELIRQPNFLSEMARLFFFLLKHNAPLL